MDTWQIINIIVAVLGYNELVFLCCYSLNLLLF